MANGTVSGNMNVKKGAARDVDCVMGAADGCLPQFNKGDW